MKLLSAICKLAPHLLFAHFVLLPPSVVAARRTAYGMDSAPSPASPMQDEDDYSDDIYEDGGEYENGPEEETPDYDNGGADGEETPDEDEYSGEGEGNYPEDEDY